MAQRVSALLSEPQSNIDSGVERLLAAYEELKGKMKLMRLDIIREKAFGIAPTDGNRIVLLPDATVAEMREFSAVALANIGGMLVIISGENGAYKYVISSQNIEVSALAKEINSHLSGRGGGRGYMIQGSFYTTFEKIEE